MALKNVTLKLTTSYNILQKKKNTNVVWEACLVYKCTEYIESDVKEKFPAVQRY